MSASTAIRLVPSDQVPKALAIFNGGNALTTAAAAPLGSDLGSVVGWRGAFMSLVPVALITLVRQWVSLPAMKPSHAAPAMSSHCSIGAMSRSAWPAAAPSFMGQFALFTCLRPFLETVTRVNVLTLSLCDVLRVPSQTRSAATSACRAGDCCRRLG
jgi:predicted MFS family arabinose efflux permease